MDYSTVPDDIIAVIEAHCFKFIAPDAVIVNPGGQGVGINDGDRESCCRDAFCDCKARRTGSSDDKIECTGVGGVQ